MAEATDRPREEIGAMPAMSEPYRPLSLLALASFVVAVLYSIAVVAGGAVALFNRVPWLMPVSSFFVPVVAVILAWVARTRIRDSEDTLSGSAFASWGIRLSVVVGLSYAAYYGFSFFAVRMQALACAEQFFAQIENGRPDKAFLLAMNIPVQGVEDSELRNRLESQFNSPAGPRSSGPYSQFRHSSLVRAIELSEGQAQLKAEGVTEWEYKGGYRVDLKYHLSTPLIECDVNVETFGRDSKPGEPRGRQWHVDLKKGQTTVIPTTLKLTPLGEERRAEAQMAWNFAFAWQDKLNLMEWNDAYLGTLPPAERKQKQEVDGRKKLEEIGLIRLDPKTFWTGKSQRDDILQHVRNTLRGAEGVRTFFLQLKESEMPLVQVRDGRAIARIDAQLTYVEKGSEKNKYIVDGQLIVSANENEARRVPSSWRVEGIEVDSGRTPPERPSTPGGGP